MLSDMFVVILLRTISEVPDPGLERNPKQMNNRGNTQRQFMQTHDTKTKLHLT